jgi:hypothetical protein
MSLNPAAALDQAVERPGAAAGEKHAAAHGHAGDGHGPLVEAGRFHPAEDQHQREIKADADEGGEAGREAEDQAEANGKLGERPHPDRSEDQIRML